jgi:hypothetical protein
MVVTTTVLTVLLRGIFGSSNIEPNSTEQRIEPALCKWKVA